MVKLKIILLYSLIFSSILTLIDDSFAATIALPRTGQPLKKGANDDGTIQKGVAWPIPRFTDNGNGTVTDNLTKLIWLKNANCFSGQAWTVALDVTNLLANDACGLTDGSRTSEWRLPNLNELKSLVDISQYNPAISTGHPFTSVQSSHNTDFYWSSSSGGGLDFDMCRVVNMYGGSSGGYHYKTDVGYVWPVRGGQ